MTTNTNTNMNTKKRLLIAVGSLVLLGVGLTAGSSTPAAAGPSAGMAQEAGVEDPRGRPPVLPEQHGDGVASNYQIVVSRPLIDPEGQVPVRCLSFTVVFTGAGGRLLARMGGQRVLPAESSEGVTLELSGVDPLLDAAAASLHPDASPHSYSVTLVPPGDTTWGETESEDVLVDVSKLN